MYIDRIAALDDTPQGIFAINAVQALNPQWRNQAKALDAAYAEKGLTGPLHCVPVLLKDLYDTKDAPTTASSLSLAGSVPPDDATSVAGLRKAGAKLLEPIMKVEVVTPEEYTGSIIGDLTSRRGMVRGQDTRGNANVIDAMVPLANMFGYINNLRSMSSGRAVFTMQFDHYEAVPQNISDEIQKKYA